MKRSESQTCASPEATHILGSSDCGETDFINGSLHKQFEEPLRIPQKYLATIEPLRSTNTIT
jgi:hypothetical protein